MGPAFTATRRPRLPSQESACRQFCSLLLTLCILILSVKVGADAPVLYRTAGYGAPVRGAPDDLLFLPGYGFSAKDIVVYAALTGEPESLANPGEAPSKSTSESGVAEIVSVENVPLSLTVRLPVEMQHGQAYALWVRSPDGSWSKPALINDARPLWVSPPFVYSTGATAGLTRYIKVIGRNLEAAPGGRTHVRLSGPQSIVLTADAGASEAVEHFVAEAALPDKLAPGKYSVSVSRDGKRWVRVAGPKFEVRATLRPSPLFLANDGRFGSCQPNDERDDTGCIAAALKAASAAGGGVVKLMAGTWRLGSGSGIGSDGLVLSKGVDLIGAGATATVLERGADWSPREGNGHPSFTLEGHNVVSGIRFTDQRRYVANDRPAPVIRLGYYRGESPPGTAPDAGIVDDVVIDHNVFDRSYFAIVDGGVPIRRLTLANNIFGSFTNSLDLAGNRFEVNRPFRIEDSVISHNTFKPGSYVDAKIRQGTIASQLGAALRLDFSDNIADGSDRSFLYSPSDPPGWRAAFFWHLINNQEMVLVSRNTASCTGDKAGDGEAFSFDNNGNTFAFDAARTVLAATPDSVTVDGPLVGTQSSRKVDIARYYLGHWLLVGDGPGVGQARKITGYTIDKRSGAVKFTVSPTWDVPPVAGASRVDVGRNFWQLYVVGNAVDHRAPPCTKGNASDQKGGGISLWAQASDSAINGNTMMDADGILLHPYSAVRGASCPACEHSTFAVYSSEIRGNRIDGEYDQASDCSASGISLAIGTEGGDVAPPIMAYGLSISHNRIDAADAEGGGSIALSYAGPANLKSPLVSNTLVFHNHIAGTRSRPVKACRRPGSIRPTAIQLGSARATRNSVLHGNSCTGAAKALAAEPFWGKVLCGDSNTPACGCRH